MSTVTTGWEHGRSVTTVATGWEHGETSALLHCHSMVAEYLGRCEGLEVTFTMVAQGCKCSYD